MPSTRWWRWCSARTSYAASSACRKPPASPPTRAIRSPGPDRHSGALRGQRRRNGRGSRLRLRRRRLAAAAALGHELVELGLVLGVAQPVEKFHELALLLLEA